MTRNVLSSGEVQQGAGGYSIGNAAWKELILERAREEKERRKKISPVVTGARDEVVPAAVFEELGALAPETQVPADPRQSALDEAEAIVRAAREESEAIASNIREDAKARASLMVEKAQSEAREILERAKTEALSEATRIKAQATEEGRQAGIEQGLAEGREKGRLEGRAEFEALLKQWAGVLTQTVEERKRTLTEARSLVVDLVGEALYQCLKEEGLRRSDMVVRFVEEALKKAHDRIQLRVHLNPDDLGTVESRRNELQVSVGSSRIELVPDARIEKGGCLLETEAGSIDVRLSTVVAQAMDALSPGD